MLKKTTEDYGSEATLTVGYRGSCFEGIQEEMVNKVSGNLWSGPAVFGWCCSEMLELHRCGPVDSSLWCQLTQVRIYGFGLRADDFMNPAAGQRKCPSLCGCVCICVWCKTDFTDYQSWGNKLNLNDFVTKMSTIVTNKLSFNCNNFRRQLRFFCITVNKVNLSALFLVWRELI